MIIGLPLGFLAGDGLVDAVSSVPSRSERSW